jgi:ionotropic glutamate receptor
VPNRASFTDFVTEVHVSHKIKGYCIDVFLKALELVPYHVPYMFQPFGNGRSNPKYDDLVKMVAADVSTSFWLLQLQSTKQQINIKTWFMGIH